MSDMGAWFGYTREVHLVEHFMGVDRRCRVTVGDGGVQRIGPGFSRRALSFTVEFTDGRRASEWLAYCAARVVADRVFSPNLISMWGLPDHDHDVERVKRKDGPRNGRTMYRYLIWDSGRRDEFNAGVDDLERRADAIQEREPGMTRLDAIKEASRQRMDERFPRRVA